MSDRPTLDELRALAAEKKAEVAKHRSEACEQCERWAYFDCDPAYQLEPVRVDWEAECPAGRWEK